MSSPTLEQYHVASRSPEQRKSSVSSGVVLPPLKTMSNTETTVPSPQKQEDDVRAKSELTLDDSYAAPETERHSVAIKLEAAPSPQEHPQEGRFLKDPLKTTTHVHSPLRESSVALPTTEQAPPTMKKRPAPAKAKKKGTATAAKKPPKKRKLDVKALAIKTDSRKGTPAASSPTPSDALADDYEEDDESMADSDEDVEGSGDVYCLCRKPDNGTFMIGCDGGCDDWFHGKCVSIEERDKNLIDKYICPRCAEAGIGRTSWKRICRRQGCRLPARVGRNAKNGATSKYCSDECGVLYFRQMAANSRGAEQAHKDRASRRKSGVADSKVSDARGSLLSTREVRAMLDQTNSSGEFRELGNGVLSPPATPSGNGVDADEGMTELESDAVKIISTQKEQARQRHQLLKDRLKFITYVKNEASRAASEKDLKPKEYCGFDSRLEWTEEEFAEWRQSPQGQQAFELETLEESALTATEDSIGKEPQDSQVCTRKKCARHTDWSKLTVDDVRFEMTDNSDRMRSLEQREQDIRERASIRARSRMFGEESAQIEVHAAKEDHKADHTMAEAQADEQHVSTATEPMDTTV